MTQLPKALVILLHGVGSSGRDMAGLIDQLAPHLPHIVFAAPDAPFAFDRGGPGRQWFSIAGVTEANRPARVAEAREAFDQTVEAGMARAGLSGQPQKLVFVGFSQGSIMALDALASGAWPIAGVVSFSGRLASPEPLAPAEGSKVLLIHGEADGVIPAVESTLAAERLAALGVSVETHIEPGLGHGISAGGLAKALTFLGETLLVTGDK